MNFVKNYKSKILIILSSGFLIVTLISMISLFYVYQYKHVQLLTKSSNVIKLFEGTFENILRDINYLENIDFSKNTTTILSEFKKISLTVYKYNDNINAISLIKQFNTKDYDKLETELIFIENIKRFGIRQVPSIIEHSRLSNSDFSSIIMHSEPLEKTQNSVGIEISSEKNRYLGILNMNLMGSYVISKPVSLVHKYKIKTTNSILFYPLYKDKKDSFYEWFVAVPFTYKKILDNIFSKNSSLNGLCVMLLDEDDKSILATYGMDTNSHMTLLLEKTVYVGQKNYTLKVFTDSLFTLDTFWQNILGFIVGLFFLSCLGYYLFYKEKKSLEISKLKFSLSEAQKISLSGHCIWKKDEDFFTCSEGLCDILMTEVPTISLKNLLKIVSCNQKTKLYRLIVSLKKRNVPDNDNVTLKILVKKCVMWLKLEYRIFYDESNDIEEVFIVVQDITSSKELEITLKENNEELEKIATTDYLTGAFNRVYFDKIIKNELTKCKEQQQVFSILLLDIDYFKKVNDLYGHNEGDRVLLQFSKLISSHLREKDTFARWGGEEFVVLLSNIDTKNATIVAEKLRQITENFEFSKEYSITCSVGISEFQKNDTTEELFNRADNALYYAKENGRNLVKAN